MIIKFEQTTAEYKKGFKSAMKMILEWSEHPNATIEKLILLLKGGLILDDLMEKKLKN